MDLVDAGGGAGTWTVASDVRNAPAGRAVRLVLPATVTVPGKLTVSTYVGRGSAPGDLDAYVELRRGSDVRRVPIWGRVTAGALLRHETVALSTPGMYRGTTARQGSFVTRYRYPETPSGIGVTTTLRGPERVFRLRLTKRVANFGVVITARGARSRVEPRVVAGLDENRLTGYAGLPVNHNPYMDEFREPLLAAGALSPLPGEYAVVFDSAARAGAGPFTFRYWVNDVTPPTLRLAYEQRPARAARRGLGDRCRSRRVSGVDPSRGRRHVDAVDAAKRSRLGPNRRTSPGTHRLRMRVSDYQEAKNTENVARILPNTRTTTFTFRVR